jgi:HSP90 family molecular chaperone
MTTIPGQKTTSLKVKADVVKHLSLGLYRNFALAIKELVSNAYDADATDVKIKLDLDKGLIVIRDNGRGMSEGEFTEDYLTVAKVKKP